MSKGNLSKGNTEAKKGYSQAKTIFKMSAFPMLVIMLIGVYLIIPYLSTQNAIKNYQNNKYELALDNLKYSSISLFDTMVNLYNSATIKSQLKDYPDAQDDFEGALGYGNVDDPALQEITCKIVYNFVLTLERWADQEVSNKRQPEGIILYTKALKINEEWASCFKDSTVKDRISEKLKVVKEAEVSPTDDSKKDDEKEESTQQKELREVEEQAQRVRNEDNASNRKTEIDNNIDFKQW